ncbi:MAG: PIN domain-containing protein [Methanobacterium sp.]
MSELKLALDSDVFKNKEFCKWLLESKEEKYLPAMAYMEYLNHHLKNGNTESMVDAFLEQMNITVVPFGKKEAVTEAKSIKKDWNSTENVRDYAIGATAINLNAKLVTSNLKKFSWLDNVATMDEILKKNY